ncbi:phosphopantetheine-binding protein [Actinosynnema sp. NPDC047251]|uniref:Amino acid thiolation domain containing protein n=1 Tax=Saccharothrix espanaensis (strain ATCC 51144 / DSM 44229 / JCM 9112 / NBRC 15066 / NRRL 15764) TaxID=1179773 RepID=K0JQF7_SACES|nr:phosphopantetheine-binding protein [Saccharothrix espanaensis]CCH29560.1 Amino acid thiolation domain containing protein [Saccharothrix espanaensis DSM 44229]
MPEEGHHATDAGGSGAADRTAADRTAAEQVIGQIWEELLAIDPPERDSRFFAVGGDSITCVRFVALACRRGVRITLRDVLVDDRLHAIAERAGHTADLP